MSNGVVIEMFITSEPGAPMDSVNPVSAVQGRGLLGDRYYSLSGTFSKTEIEPDQEITLIESEAFEELKEKHGITLKYLQSRRNIITRDVNLNNLVGRKFQVGDVTLTGRRLCEPCTYLSGLTDNPKLVKQWLHRAGLRAQIVSSGKIIVGDSIIT